MGLDGTLYDQVLDFIFYLGLAPPRFSVRGPSHAPLHSFSQHPQLLHSSQIISRPVHGKATDRVINGVIVPTRMGVLVRGMRLICTDLCRSRH